MLNNLLSFKKQKSSYSWRHVAAGVMTFAGVMGSIVAAYRKQQVDKNDTGSATQNTNTTNGQDTTGNSHSYEEWTKDQLYDKAQDLDIEGRSTMNKAELVEAIEKY